MTTVEWPAPDTFTKREILDLWEKQRNEIQLWIQENIICEDAIYHARIGYSKDQKYSSGLTKLVWKVDILDEGNQLFFKF